MPNEVHAILDERTNPTWPTTWFAPRVTGKGAFAGLLGFGSAFGDGLSISVE